MEFSWLQAVGVFFAAVIGDILWTAYITRSADRKKHAAAFYSSILWVSGAAVVLSYNQNIWYIIPGVVGSYVGTYLLLTYDERKKNGKIN